MRRGYTLAEYREKVDLIRSLMPEASITTDLIVGFCGETEAEFQESCDLLRRAPLRQGPRRRLLAPRPAPSPHRKMEDDVPLEVKKERLHAIEELEARSLRRAQPRYEGTRAGSPRRRQRDGRWHGRTRCNKLVHFAGEAAIGEVVTVRIERTTAWSLQGTTADDALPLLI